MPAFARAASKSCRQWARSGAANAPFVRETVWNFALHRCGAQPVRPEPLIFRSRHFSFLRSNASRFRLFLALTGSALLLDGLRLAFHTDVATNLPRDANARCLHSFSTERSQAPQFRLVVHH